MIPIPIGIGDFLKISDASFKWLGNIKGKKEQAAAKVLISTGLIVAGIRLLDNSIQKLFGYVKLGVGDLTREQRETLVRQINDFAREQVLLSKIRVHYEELDGLDFPKIVNSIDDIAQIKKSANDMLSVLVAGSSPFASKEELEAFLRNLRNQNSQKEEALLNQVCNDILSLYEQSIIEEAEKALGNLRGKILKKYPDIPYPHWM